MGYKQLPLILLPSLAFGASFKAFKNSKCDDPLTITSGNSTIPNNELLIDTAITNWNGSHGPAGHWYNKMGYQGAAAGGSINGTGANNVYWKAPDADEGCTLVLMRQTHGPDEGWKTLTPLPGEIALIAQDEGCYYSSLNDFDGLITSYCCGEGDCAGVHMGTNLFMGQSKRDVAEKTPRSPLSNTAAASRTVRHADKARAAPPPEVLEDLDWAVGDGSPEKFKDYKNTILKRGLWDKIVDFFTPDPPEVSTPPLPSNIPEPSSTPTPEPAEPEAPACTIVGEPKKIGVTTGQQRIVTDPQSCDTGPATCAHTVSVSFQASTALSHSKSSTWTATGGVNVGVDVGVNFIADAKVSTTLSTSLAKAWGEDTGTTVTTGWSNSTSQTIVQQVGTHAMLTFTPYYVCWRGDASCGKDDKGEEIKVEGMDFCQPSMKGTGNEVMGFYSVVYM